MSKTDNSIPGSGQPLEDNLLHEALTALGRSINIATTYGSEHPVVEQAIEATHAAMEKLFTDRKKIILGTINGVMTIDRTPVVAGGTLLKSLERRLVRLGVTGLRIARGISSNELTQLVKLLASNETKDFAKGIDQASLSNISTDNTRYEAVHEGETVANKGDLAGAGGSNGVLVLDDGMDHGGGNGGGEGASTVHVEQIVAFLKGDIESDEHGIREELADLASDPDRLGQMIMESVAIRQQASALSGESLSDVVLGCLRRTYNGLRKQPAFQTSEGTADLQKALLLLEESVLDKLRGISDEPNEELDRQIVQAIREMDENLGFELAAHEYVEHRDAIEQNKEQMKAFLKMRGPEAAEEMLQDSEFPRTEWRKIVVESDTSANRANPPVAAGLNTLANVFEKLENLMKAEDTDDNRVKDLLGQANENIDDTASSTQEKLDSLSRQLDTGTIGGEAGSMTRKELLSSIAEVTQELMQPLTAINASLEMMLSGYVGQVSAEQKNMLTLACNSGEHLTYLMKELIAIVGCPTNKGVDKRFHTTSEEVVLMKQKER